MFLLMLAVISLFIQSFFVPAICWAEWTPLIDSGMFSGIQADVSTAVGGIVAIALIILGASLLMSALRR
jgi:hypothetical protein